MTTSDEVTEEAPTLAELLLMEQKYVASRQRSTDKARGWARALEALLLDDATPEERDAHAFLLGERRRILADGERYLADAKAHLRAAEMLMRLAPPEAPQIRSEAPADPPPHEAF